MPSTDTAATTVLLRRGVVIDDSAAAGPADVLIDRGRIVAIGDLPQVNAAQVIDCTDRLIAPGFVDAHSHTDGAIFRDDVQLALLRQGVTTVIGGQDGVSYAPGDGEFATHYFAAINGPHPSYHGPGVADLLAGYDGTIRLGVAYLIPAGTVRHEVLGSAERPATADDIARMRALVTKGLDDGAVGLSTGLDYTPGLFADAAELAELCRPVAAAGLPYVSHMRGGYEDNAEAGVREILRIAEGSGVAVHISHFHTPAAEAERLMGLLAEHDIRASYDAYPYTRGCTLVAMALLPPRFNAMPTAEAVALLRRPEERAQLRHGWFRDHVTTSPSLGPDWPEMITIGHTPAPEFSDAHGRTIAQIAAARGTDAIDAALDLLIASNLEANAIMAVRDQRPVEDLGRLFQHPAHRGGSDGIFIGAHPHPRAFGNFAAYLGTYVRERGFLDWPTAVDHFSTAPAALFHLGARGRVRPGYLADLIVIDPARVRDRATYANPTRLSEGIDDVLVAGRRVLADGRLTEERPGGGIRAGRDLLP